MSIFQTTVKVKRRWRKVSFSNDTAFYDGGKFAVHIILKIAM